METEYKSALSRINSGYAELKPHVARWSLYMAPVLLPNELQLSEDRKKTILTEEMEYLNNLIRHTFQPELVPTVFNQMSEGHRPESYDPAGLHFINELCDLQARLLLNLRCNSEVPELVSPQACCAKRKPAFAGWVLLVVLSSAGFAVALTGNSKFMVALCLAACYGIAHGIHVQREIGTSIDGLGVVTGVLMCARFYNLPEHLVERQNMVRGLLMLILFGTMFVFRDTSAIPFEAANWIVSMIIVELTARQVRRGLQRDDYEEAAGRMSILVVEMWELAKTLLDQNLAMGAVVILVNGSLVDSNKFFRVFPSALHCGLHLSMFTTAAWLVGRVLRQFRVSSVLKEENVHSVSLKAVGWTMFLLKVFLVLVTFLMPMYIWEGLPLLDMFSLKFGIMGGMMSSGISMNMASRVKSKLRMTVRMSGGLALCLYLALWAIDKQLVRGSFPEETTTMVEIISTLYQLVHAFFVATFLTSFAVLEDMTDFCVPPAAGLLLDRIGRLNWELVVFVDLVFFPSKGSEPSLASIPRLGFPLSLSVFEYAYSAGAGAVWTFVESAIVGICLIVITVEVKTLYFKASEAMGWRSPIMSSNIPLAATSVNTALPSGALAATGEVSGSYLPTFHERME